MSDRGMQLVYGVAANDVRSGDPLGDATGTQHMATVFADRPHVRAVLAEDAAAAGLRVSQCASLTELQGDPAIGDGRLLPGDLVLVDIPTIDAQGTAMLAELDSRVARAGACIIVSTSIGALDAVFGCFDQSRAQILVEPTRAERVLAMGRARLSAGAQAVNELSEEDRITLLRLSQQVEDMARKIEQLSGSIEMAGDDPSGFRVESPALAFRHGVADPGDRLVRGASVRGARPALPDPRLVRRIIRQRQLRARFFESDLFSDPAWDMLLDLTAARAEHLRVSVTSLCIASAVPPTTALRWINQMIDMGLMQRLSDETDRRRAFIALTDKAADAMARYFADLGNSAVKLV